MRLNVITEDDLAFTPSQNSFDILRDSVADDRDDQKEIDKECSDDGIHIYTPYLAKTLF